MGIGIKGDNGCIRAVNGCIQGTECGIEVACCPGLILSRRLRIDWWVIQALVTVASGTDDIVYSNARGGWYWRRKVEPGVCDWDLRLLMHTQTNPFVPGCFGCISHWPTGAADDVTVPILQAGGGAEYCSDVNSSGPASFGVQSCDPFLMSTPISGFGVGTIRAKCLPFAFNSKIHLEVREW